MKVCIFVANPCVRDSRVLKQASTFARAGHETMVIGLTRGGIPEKEVRDGFEIRRVRVGALALRDRVPRLRRARSGSGPPAVGASDASAPASAADPRRRLSRGGFVRWLITGEPPVPRSWERSVGTFATRLFFVGKLSVQAAGKPVRIVRRKAIFRLKRFMRVARKVRAPFWWIERRMARVARSFGPELCWANDANTLRPAYRVARARKARLFYDAHEAIWDAHAWPESERERWSKVERRFVGKAERVFTVNRPIADAFASRYGIARPTVLLNCPRLSEITAGTTREDSPLNGWRGLGERLVLYHGGLSRWRGLEELVDAVPSLPGNYRLIFMGYGVLRDDLERRAAERGLTDRITFVPAVPPEALLDWIRGADVGVIPILPVGQYRYATPNKLFECMHAGLPIVVNEDLAEVRRIAVDEVAFGIAADSADPPAFAKAIEALASDDELCRAMRARALEAAPRFSWEEQEQLILSAVGA